MALSPSNFFLNFKSFTVTYGTGTPTVLVIPEIDDIDHPLKGKMIERWGDANRFPRIVNTVEQTRPITVNGGAPGLLAAVPMDVPCTLTWLEADAKNKFLTGGGGYTYTAVNAVLHDNPYATKNNAYATGGLVFECAQDASDADPISKVLL